MAAVQAVDARASFLFVGDLNGIIRNGWVLLRRTVMVLRHFDFPTVSGCDQLVIGPTHARGGTLDILMTDLVRVAVEAPLGSCIIHHSRKPF